jgi:MoaA/NifB/PqqE/SkfB family radical SAM enzyme
MADETFCVLPWVHAATLTDGSVQLCCVSGGGSGVNLNDQTLADYWNSDYVRDARRRMLAGKKVKACRRCYVEEALGRRSHRVVENEVWQARLGADAIHELTAQTAADGSLLAPPQYLDLRLGNTCNMQCVMCQPRESSRWLPTARKLSQAFEGGELKDTWDFKSSINANRFEWYRNPEFWSQLKVFLPHVKELILAGGEPLLIKEGFAFVRACCETGEASHIRLRYHTNGTVFPEQMVPYWEQFEQVHFMVSIDGIGAVADYVRHPSDWDAIEANVRRLDGLGENTLTNFHFTTHALNVYRMLDVLDWADRSGLRNRERVANLQDYVHPGLVHHPAYMSIRVLPADHKRVVTDRIVDYINTRLAGQQADKLTAILNFMNSEDHSEKMPSLVEYTSTLDGIRGSDILQTLPELAPFWARYGEVHSKPDVVQASRIG